LKQRHQPPNSKDLNNLDYHLWGTGHAEKVSQTATEPKTLAELKAALPLWNDMPLEPITNAVKDFTKRMKACVQANVGTLNT